ncbi:MAG: pre-peptidase C-terminal domain-containing protein [Planctomyces sp.]|nr:pre-peptidase C-terminal domain-containing protein [Planctomyces sp.]
MQSLEPRIVLAAPDPFESDNTAATARVIGLNETPQNRTLHAGTDVDWASFKITALSNVVIQTAGSAGDTYLRLYGPNSTTKLLASDDDSGDGSFSRLTRTLEPGVYYAEISEYGQNSPIESYKLQVVATPALPDAFESDNTRETAREIRVNSAVQSRSLHTTRDEDWARISISEPTLLTVETAGTAGDTFLELFAEGSSTRLAYDYDSGVGEFARLEYPVEAGTYFVRVTESGQDAAVPGYTLNVTGASLAQYRDGFETDDTRTQAAVIMSYGEAQTRTLHRPNDVDWIRFQVEKTSEVYFDLRNIENRWGYAKLDLYSAGGATPIASSSYSFRRVLQPGTWYIVVSETGKDGIVNKYSLAVTATPVPDLRVKGLTLTTPNQVPIGQPVGLSWMVNNIAGADLTGRQWTDRIYLSSDNLPGGDTQIWTENLSRSVSSETAYSQSASITITNDLAWAGRSAWLIVQTDSSDTIVESSETNNSLAFPIQFAPHLGIEAPFTNQYLSANTTTEAAFRAIDGTGKSSIRLAIDSDSDPGNNAGHTWLTTAGTLKATAGNQLQKVNIKIPNLTPRVAPYYVWAEISTASGTRKSSPVPVYVLDRASTSQDVLGDMVGGSGYEVFGIDAGQMGGALRFRVRTNYNPSKPFTGTGTGGGDLRLQFGGQTYGLAINSHQTLAGQVAAGDLYTGVTFYSGTTVRTVPTFISGYSQRITGKSSVQFEEVSGRPWKYEISVSIDTSALPAAAAAGITASWAMYCGNDTDDVSIIPDLKPKPVTDLVVGEVKASTSGLITYSYEIQGAPLPAAAGIAAYWVDQTDRLLGSPIWTSTTSTAIGKYGPLIALTTQSEDRPRDAVRIALILDPSNAVREQNEFNNRADVEPNDPDDQISEATVVTMLPASAAEKTGRLTNRDVDMYSVRVEAGRKMAFDLDAIGIRGALRIFDAAGRELRQGSGVWIKNGLGELIYSANSVAGTTETMREPEAHDLAEQAYLEVLFPVAGTYYVGVSQASNSKYDAVTGQGDAASDPVQGSNDYRLIITPITVLPATGTTVGVVHMPNPNGHLSVIETTLTPVGGGPIRSGQPTWVVIHGRVDSSRSFEQLATDLQTSTGQQVLLLDWEHGAADNNGDHLFVKALGGAEWIPYVADWAAAVLRSHGLTGGLVNLAGHSWGSYVAARIAAPERLGRINALVAMDPAQDGAGFDGAGTQANQIHFGNVSNFSWAFYGNGSFGSSAIAATASESFSVISSDFSNIPITNSLQRHTAPIHVFHSIVRLPGSFSANMTLQRLLAARRNPLFRQNSYMGEGSFIESPRGRFHEGVIRVRSVTDAEGTIFWTPVRLGFVHSTTGREIFVNY